MVLACYHAQNHAITESPRGEHRTCWSKALQIRSTAARSTKPRPMINSVTRPRTPTRRPMTMVRRPATSLRTRATRAAKTGLKYV